MRSVSGMARESGPLLIGLAIAFPVLHCPSSAALRRRNRTGRTSIRPVRRRTFVPDVTRGDGGPGFAASCDPADLGAQKRSFRADASAFLTQTVDRIALALDRL